MSTPQGIYPLFFSSYGLGVAAIGVLKAVYPAVWGMTQVIFGPLSDRCGRKWLIACGLVVQAVGIWQTVLMSTYASWLLAAVLQGLGTAMVYPTLLAAISDVAHPEWRATSMGVYRLWRDAGYAVGALLSGLVADLLGMRAAIHLVAALTLGSVKSLFPWEIRQQTRRFSGVGNLREARSLSVRPGDAVAASYESAVAQKC